MGRYELLERLAEGGMAEVFLARATGSAGFGRKVIIKQLLRDLEDDPAYQRMILDEARVASHLQHENIAQVYDVGWNGDRLYIAMEFVDGVSVQTMLREASHRNARVPIEHTIAIVMGVAAGLHHAHRRRDEDGVRLDIVHRDVSLDNIIVTREGCPKLIDFGVAKFARRESRTPTGTLKGKLAYMSPEQVAFGRVDARSDVWSLGVVLYEMSTGRRLFRGRDDLHAMRLVIEQPIQPPSELVADYPRALEEIVMSALQRDSELRPQSARALHEALMELAYEYDLRLSRYGLADYVHRMVVAEEVAPIGRQTCELNALADDAIASLRLPTAG